MRDIRCLLFGHAPNIQGIQAALQTDGHECRRCGEYFTWASCGRSVMASVIKARRVLLSKEPTDD